ncbi:hypothetical protein BLS_004063 [Venturia inaequalis]|uniref:MFS general substrate transporter n=1 Tax=Venturia inaequalis TaxID=5025 RepID=A0A8H3YUF4_VENIN|nr:hypothetical protein BLS_004063 [Venturia inaequalis]
MIDRANIGNARIQGLTKDLKLTGFKFNWSLTVFYITYMCVEIPSNMLLKYVGPKFWIPFLVASFGAVSLGTAFVKSFDGLLDSNEKVTLKHIRMAIFNVHTTICTLGFLSVNVSVQSISLFMPTILNDMGYTAIQAQLHSVPPYVTACALSIAVAFVSDRTKRRGVYLAGFAMLSMIGFALLRSHSIKSVGVKYFAIFLVATGAFPGGPGFLSWAINNSAGPAVRAIASAYVVSVGTIGAVVATWTYLEKDKKSGYITGHTINLGAQICVALLAISGILYCQRENKIREAGGRDQRLEGLSEREVVELGYRHPEFRYIP